MKSLNSLFDKAYDLAAENLENPDFLEFETLLKHAKKGVNSLVEALAQTTPYHRYAGGLSARCIHCNGKYDPTANPTNERAHHESGCIWLRAVELVRLCNQPKPE